MKSLRPEFIISAFNVAAKSYLVDKTCKFIRAHIAAILVKHAPVVDTVLFSIVECSLELDAFMYYKIIKKGTNADPLPIVVVVADPSESLLAQSTSSIFYDSKDTYMRWLAADMNYYKECIMTELDSESDIYRVQSVDIGNSGSLDVYRGVLFCCNLFVVACKRYIFQPKLSQIVASKFILEPLLCYLGSILLYRIRSHPLLRLVVKARNALKAQRNMSTNVLTALGVRPQDYSLFKMHTAVISSSIQYIKQYLNGVMKQQQCSSIAIGPASTSASTKDFHIDNCWLSYQNVIKSLVHKHTEHLSVELNVRYDTLESQHYCNTVNNFSHVVFREYTDKLLQVDSLGHIMTAFADCNLETNTTMLYLTSSVEYIQAQLEGLDAIVAE